MAEIDIEIDFPYPDVQRVSELSERGREQKTLSDYLRKRGITEEQMKEAREATRRYIDQYKSDEEPAEP